MIYHITSYHTNCQIAYVKYNIGYVEHLTQQWKLINTKNIKTGEHIKSKIDVKKIMKTTTFILLILQAVTPLCGGMTCTRPSVRPQP